MKNLFGENEPDHAKPSRKDTNPMLALYGQGPADQRCKDCIQLVRFKQAKAWHKCALRRGKRSRWGGPATDHKANWPACGRFAPKSNE